MENTFKKLSEEIKQKLEAQLQSEAVQKAIEQIKAAGDEDTGSFEVVISTADVDRAGETIDQNGWDLSFYKSNPIVLWAHDYSSLPIGVTENIEMRDGKLVASGRFAPESANPLAQHVRRLYDLKIVRAASVGFIPREFDPNNPARITKAELLEWSFVPVPANPNALSLMKSQSIDVEAMLVKGILLKNAENAEGSQMQENGTPAVGESEGSNGSTGAENAQTGANPAVASGGEVPSGSEIVETGETQQSGGEVAERAVDFELNTDKHVLIPILKLDPINGSKRGEEIPITEEFEQRVLNMQIAEAAIKAGRVLSEKNRTLVKSTIDGLKTVTVALQELYEATEPQKSQSSEGEDPDNEQAPNERSKTVAVGFDGFEEDQSMQQLLRAVNNATKEALSHMYKRKSHRSR